MFLRQNSSKSLLLSYFIIRHFQIINQPSHSLISNYNITYFTFRQISIIINLIFPILIFFKQIFNINLRSIIKLIILFNYRWWMLYLFLRRFFTFSFTSFLIFVWNWCWLFLWFFLLYLIFYPIAYYIEYCFVFYC